MGGYLKNYRRDRYFCNSRINRRVCVCTSQPKYELAGMKKLLPLLLLFFWATLAFAQDPIFSQFYAMPLQINPGFAGSARAPRAGLAYRNQWTGFQSAYRTYAAYYEQSFDRLNSGIGFHVEGDNAGDGIFKTNVDVLKLSAEVEC